MLLPILYKKTQTGKIQEYSIHTEGNKIITVQGQLNGKHQVHTRYAKTMNEGRANETTPEQQAELEAQSKWDKKKNKDYFLTIEEALQDHTTSNEGGFIPMLAQSYDKRKQHLKFPCYVQPKLDGLRCIATKNNGEVKLWFRSGKEVVTMGHIVKDLESVMVNGDIFDGELYIHGEDFNSFTGSIRASKNADKEKNILVEYHIYDYPRIQMLQENTPFTNRLIRFSELVLEGNHLEKVRTEWVEDFEQAMEIYKRFIDEGYEGIMFRNVTAPYEQKRSNNLLKYKEFVDDEFIIIGYTEGKGKLRGHIGSFICKVEEGREILDFTGETKIYKAENDPRTIKEGKGTVKAKLKGDTKYLKELFEDKENCIGKSLTIQYQNLSEYCIPRFPVGKTIRFDL